MYHRFFRLTLLALALAASAAQGEVYKWVDEGGAVHYSDVPQPQAERLDIRSRPTDPERLAAERERLRQQREERTEQRRVAEEQRAEADAEAALRSENCDKARRYFAHISTLQRLYETQPDGERRYYSDAEQDGALTKARANIEEWCGEQ